MDFNFNAILFKFIHQRLTGTAFSCHRAFKEMPCDAINCFCFH